jgi:hypothetical protein
MLWGVFWRWWLGLFLSKYLAHVFSRSSAWADENSLPGFFAHVNLLFPYG